MRKRIINAFSALKIKIKMQKKSPQGTPKMLYGYFMTFVFKIGQIKAGAAPFPLDL